MKNKNQRKKTMKTNKMFGDGLTAYLGINSIVINLNVCLYKCGKTNNGLNGERLV